MFIFFFDVFIVINVVTRITHKNTNVTIEMPKIENFKILLMKYGQSKQSKPNISHTD